MTKSLSSVNEFMFINVDAPPFKLNHLGDLGKNISKIIKCTVKKKWTSGFKYSSEIRDAVHKFIIILIEFQFTTLWIKT